MRYFFILATLLTVQAFAQSDSGSVSVANLPEENDTVETLDVVEPVYMNYDSSAKFPGGNAALSEFLSDHLHYPMQALENGVQGIIKVSFVIDKLGRVKNVKTIGDTIGYGLEKEAIRIMKLSPHWHPAKHNNEPVAVYFLLPIEFRLSDE